MDIEPEHLTLPKYIKNRKSQNLALFRHHVYLAGRVYLVVFDVSLKPKLHATQPLFLGSPAPLLREKEKEKNCNMGQ